MTNSLYTLPVNPRSLKEFADTKPEIAAVGVNAVTGILLVLTAAAAMAPLFSNTLVVLLGILFGPLAGFLVSSTYPRIEVAVGRRMGGKASLDELYRLFAWSFLLVGFASLFYSLLLKLVQKPGICLPSSFYPIARAGNPCRQKLLFQYRCRAELYGEEGRCGDRHHLDTVYYPACWMRSDYLAGIPLRRE